MAVTKDKQKMQPNMASVTWGNITWINIVNATEQETEYLAKHYPFHPLDLDDCLSRIQRPKIDEYREYLFLVFHFPVFNKETRVITASQLSVFIGENYLITLHKGELKPLVKLFKECQIEDESREKYLGQGTGFLLYRIIDRLVDYCFPLLSKILDNIEEAENAIFSENKRDTVKEISLLRRDIISFRRIIWPMRAVVGSMEPKVRRFMNRDMQVYFGDLVDHVDKIWDALDECKEIIEGLSDTHDSLATNRTNEVIRIVTVIATVLLPITVVASVWGMNIPLPFQNSSLPPLLYVSFIMIVIISGMLYFFRRRRWI